MMPSDLPQPRNLRSMCCVRSCGLVDQFAAACRPMTMTGTATTRRFKSVSRFAPVHLTLTGLNHARVGKGSYIVNAQGDCNGLPQQPGPGRRMGPRPQFRTLGSRRWSM